MTKLAAEKLYKKVGVSAKDVQVVELHNCFSAMSLLHTYEALGLRDVGKSGEFIDAGDNNYVGKYVVKKSCTNTSLAAKFLQVKSHNDYCIFILTLPHGIKL